MSNEPSNRRIGVAIATGVLIFSIVLALVWGRVFMTKDVPSNGQSAVPGTAAYVYEPA